MFVELNSKIGAQLDPMGVDTRGSEPMAEDESEGPMTQTSLEVKSVFGSIAVEVAAPEAVSSHLSSICAAGSELKIGAGSSAASRALSDCRSWSCSS